MRVAQGGKPREEDPAKDHQASSLRPRGELRLRRRWEEGKKCETNDYRSSLHKLDAWDRGEKESQSKKEMVWGPGVKGKVQGIGPWGGICSCLTP